MYRIRFHGRGGQGIKTASRILGTTLFMEGFEVQDGPRYGAERRGAPMFAYVRASMEPIQERGIIRLPDLVIVTDDSLIPIPAAGVLTGVAERTVLLINSDEEPGLWRERLALAGPILTLPAAAHAPHINTQLTSVLSTGAAANLIGVISRRTLEEAIRKELAPLGAGAVEVNLENGLKAFDLTVVLKGSVREGGKTQAASYDPPDWIDLPFEEAAISAPAIHATATSERVKTGVWRTMRPVIDYSLCNRCWWICSTFCADGVIRVDEEGYPRIDYEHCKGCMICVAQCPRHAISAIPEHGEDTGERQE